MSLSVQQPSSRKVKPVDPIEDGKNTLDNILTGLEMANAALGIAGNVDKLSSLNKQIPGTPPSPGAPSPETRFVGVERFPNVMRAPKMTYRSPLLESIRMG